jgi:cytidylate kinase
MAKNKSVIMEGRDIGSVILPDADLKIFLIANEQTRVLRRHKELQEKGYHISLEEIKTEIIKRDELDSKRAIAPLTIPEDAIVVDTSNKGIEEVIEILLGIIYKKEKEEFADNQG